MFCTIFNFQTRSRQLGMREIYYKNEDGLYSEKNDCAENTIYALIDLVTYIGNREKRYEK